MASNEPAVWVPPRWLPAAVYFAGTLVLFHEFMLAGGMLFGTDTLALGYFAREYFHLFVQSLREFPLWNPLIYGGLPFMEGLHGDVFYPTTVLLFFQETHRALGWKLVVHVFLAGIFMNMWLRALGVGAAAALFGGLAYMMGSFLVTLVYPGHDGKLFVTTLAPLLFYLVERIVTKRRVLDFALLGLGVALMIYTPHMQLAYFALWGFSLWFLFRLWEIWHAERNGKVVARLFALYALAGGLGAAAAAVQLGPPLLYLREYSHRADRTIEADRERGIEYSASWSLHPEEVASLVVPDFVGSNVDRPGRNDTYWGRNPFKLNSEYLGLIPLLLLPIAFIGRRERRGWFFALLAFLALLYALGLNTPAFHLFYLIPGVSLFRAPSSIIFVVGFAAITLAAMGLQRLLDWRPAGREFTLGRQYLWVAAGAFLLLALLASTGALASLWQSALFRDMPARNALALERNMGNLQAGFWVALLLAALVAAVAEARARAWVGARGLVVVLLILTAGDLWRVNRHYILTTEPHLYFGADDAIWFLQNRQAQGEVFRVFDLGMLRQVGFNIPAGYPHNYFATHGIEEFVGHHGNELGAYRDLIGGEYPLHLADAQGRLDLRLLDIANVGYVVSPGPLELPGYRRAHEGMRSIIYENTNALPRAYLVGEVEVVDDTAAVGRLLSPDFDARRVALVPAPLEPDIALVSGVNGSVEWLDLDPGKLVQGRVNRQRLRVRSEGAALLVMTDNYHHGWQAAIGGAPAPVLRVNRTFRAVPVPAGEHIVEWRYRAPELRLAALVTVLALLLLAAVAVAGWIAEWRRPREA